MLSTITSGAVYGVHSHLIQVEVDVSQGLPCFQIVGLPGSEVREARERVKVALKNVGVKLPPMCINVNLSPADLPKNGTMFDLPVAVGIMIALGKLADRAGGGSEGRQEMYSACGKRVGGRADSGDGERRRAGREGGGGAACGGGDFPAGGGRLPR